MAIRGALLDVDGTLVLSNDGQAQAWVEAFAAYGYDAPYDKVRPMVGMGGDKIIPYVAPGLNDKAPLRTTTSRRWRGSGRRL
jgi:beta-phosphoglucomutase-like phosphatase (HAD superfamily)